jgi:hypothetical protein
MYNAKKINKKVSSKTAKNAKKCLFGLRFSCPNSRRLLHVVAQVASG